MPWKCSVPTQSAPLPRGRRLAPAVLHVDAARPVQLVTRRRAASPRAALVQRLAAVASLGLVMMLGAASTRAQSDVTAPDVMVRSAQAASFLEDPSLGASVAVAGDLNGDGYDDLVAGAPGWNAAGGHDHGAAFVFLGGPGGVVGTDPSDAHAVIEGVLPYGRVGKSVAGAGDVNGDGFDDLIVGAPLTDASGISLSGAAYVFHGGPGGITADSVAQADAMLESLQIEGHMGQDVAGAGDVNGDGYDDVIVGADLYGQPFSPPIPNQGSGRQGAAFVFLGSPSGVVGRNPDQAHARLVAWTDGLPTQVWAQFGSQVAGAGDVNGDGYADVIVGAPRWNQAAPWPGVPGEDPPEEGAAFLYLGGPSGIDAHQPPSADARLEGGQLYARFGSAVDGAGDVNGDGYDDVVIGAMGFPTSDPFLAREEGAVFVFHGGPSGLTASGPPDAQASFHGSGLAEWLGQSVEGVGDHDGDGYGDVLVGARTYPGSTGNQGVAYLFRGGPSGVTGDGLEDAALRFLQEDVNGWLGTSVGGGDLDGDGRPDLIVGAPGCTVTVHKEGAAFVYLTGEPAGGAWVDLGGASVGAEGTPTLSGTGSLQVGSPADLTLSNAPPGARLLAWMSLAPTPFAALDGTVHSFPYSSQYLFQAGGNGAFTAATTWPPGLPASTDVWFQFVVEDASTPHGLTLSNGLRATTP